MEAVLRRGHICFSVENKIIIPDLSSVIPELCWISGMSVCVWHTVIECHAFKVKNIIGLRIVSLFSDMLVVAL